MDDLVKRLRGYPGPRGFEVPLHVTMKEAADHIQQLNLDIVGLKIRITKLEAARDGAYTERNRLVALLGSIYPSGVTSCMTLWWITCSMIPWTNRHSLKLLLPGFAPFLGFGLAMSGKLRGF